MGQQPFAVLDHSFLMARGAQEAALARVSHQKFMAALRTFDPCKATMQIAALQITINDVHYVRPPESINRGIAFVPGPFQFFEVGLHALVIGAGARIARAVNIAGHKIDRQRRPHEVDNP
jgi:hypothetical protein